MKQNANNVRHTELGTHIHTQTQTHTYIRVTIVGDVDIVAVCCCFAAAATAVTSIHSSLFVWTKTKTLTATNSNIIISTRLFARSVTHRSYTFTLSAHGFSGAPIAHTNRVAHVVEGESVSEWVREGEYNESMITYTTNDTFEPNTLVRLALRFAANRKYVCACSCVCAYAVYSVHTDWNYNGVNGKMK